MFYGFVNKGISVASYMGCSYMNYHITQDNLQAIFLNKIYLIYFKPVNQLTLISSGISEYSNLEEVMNSKYTKFIINNTQLYIIY